MYVNNKINLDEIQEKRRVQQASYVITRAVTCRNANINY